MVYPVRTNLQILKWDAPVLLIVTLLVPATFLGGSVNGADGAILLLGAVAYTAWAVRIAKRDEKLGHEVHVDIPEIRVKGGVPLDLLKIAAGIGVLILASRLLVDNSIIVAKTFGLSDAVIGLTVIAAGTSMPELATSVVAARRGQADIALGNVLGSSLFNLLFVLGGAAVINPVSVRGLQNFDLWSLIGVTALMTLFLYTGRKVGRFEGLLLCLAYGIYLAVMWPK
jgi:cation:H+ antiporter